MPECAGLLMAMDTGMPELVLSRVEPVGRPVEFFVDATVWRKGVRYDLKNVAKFGPPGANAFLLQSAEPARNGRYILRFAYFRIDRRGIGDHRGEAA